MNHKITASLALPLVFVVPNLFSQVKQTSPRIAEPISAVELVNSSSLVPANEEASVQFDEMLSKPIQINDGRKRSYVLAVDELYQPTPDGVGQIVPIKESSKPSTLASVASILALEKKQETRLILYPVGAPHNDQTRRVLSRDVVVKTDNREDAINAATEAGLRLKSEPAYAKGFLIFTSDTPVDAIEATVMMRAQGIETTRPLFTSKGQPEFLPDDLYFKDEWHIRGRGQNGAKKVSDAKITPVWEQRDSSGNLIRGTGITIGIVDDGVQMDHPDLASNISTSYKINFNDGNSSDPSPGSGNNHGTCVAGVAAAVGFNGIGVSGAAPSAKIAPIRLIGGNFTSLDEAEAYAYGGSSVRIKSNSWSRQTRVNSLQPDDEIVKAALASAANAGTIITFSGGNDLAEGANTNQRGLKNSIYTLPIAAVNDQGRQCDYSNPGASLIVGAPAGGDVYGLSSSRPQGTSTTDRTGDYGYNFTGKSGDYSETGYTSGFNGTSSATPVVSGVTALVLQANPSLNWRDVKEIYIRSATKNDSSDSDWNLNGAGFWFNHKYGAGLINASEAVRLAKTGRI